MRPFYEHCDSPCAGCREGRFCVVGEGLLSEARARPSSSNIARVLHALAIDFPNRLLELGPGPGLDLSAASKLGTEHLAYIDSNPFMGGSAWNKGIVGDFYDLGILSQALPVDLVWAFGSIAASLWNESRINWIKTLQEGSRFVILTPHWGKESKHSRSGITMSWDLAALGFEPRWIEGVNVEPQCPITYIWRKR